MDLRKKIFLINLLPIVLISLNLRLPITSVGPAVELLQEHYGLNATQIGALTSLPLVAFGVVAFIVAYFAPIRAMFVALLLLVFGEIVRSIGGSALLFVGTAIMGSGIAVANVLLPTFVKAKFPRNVPKIMGLYSLLLNISAALGIALILPLCYLLPLPLAMASWVIVALCAIISFLPQIKNSRLIRKKPKSSIQKSLFAQPTAWKVTLFMALSSTMAYCFFSWYHALVRSFGYDEAFASHMMLLAQCSIIPVAYFVPVILGSISRRFKPFFMGGICGGYVLVYMLLLFFGEHTWVVGFSSFLVGVPVGGAFGVALLFISTKSANVAIATKLSAMAQGVGYLIAALGPLLLGGLYDYFGGFSEALLVLVGLGVLLCTLGLVASRARVIE